VVLVAVLGSLGLLAAAVATIPGLRWRANVIGLKLKGGIPEIGMLQLLRWTSPDSPVYLGNLEVYARIDAAVQSLYKDDPESIKVGQVRFQEKCSSCHGGNGRGAAAPNLVAFVQHSTDWSFFSTAKWGRPGTAMGPQPVSDLEIWEVHAYLRSLSREWLADMKKAAPTGPKVEVPFSSIPDLGAGDDWLTYSGGLMGHRHSTLTQINPKTVNDLRLAWAAQLRPAVKPLTVTPIVAKGVLYITEAPDGVIALNAKTGEQIWRFDRPLDPSKLPLCCGAFNRGVAILDNRVFVATLDSYLIALDATTGERLWEAEVAPAVEGYSMTSAPLALDGHIVVGVAGGEYGIRGFVSAFSPTDGKLLWKWNAIPGPGEPGHETWEGDSWKTGGASTWTAGTYDKERDWIYWPVGNPWPPLDTRVREGDNLYSNSVVALDRKTGKMQWYFQFTPNDGHDWDATQQTILTDIDWKGEKVPALLIANRNGFYYALDRRDGKFLRATAFVKQTWAKSFDEKGRPQRDASILPSPGGTMVWPWMHGGTNWWPPSYDAKRKLHFVPTVDAATLYFLIDTKYKSGNLIMGGTTQHATNQPSAMGIKALDPVTGEQKWFAKLDHGDFWHYSRIPGVVSTDGGIIVAGFMDRMSILNSDTGEEIWKFRPGGPLNSGPMTYAVDGTQYIAFTAGSTLMVWSLAPKQ
jgi:alcohol dehydrogenase (cytochrome c)